jgi:uncharacterized damage-inducible protein DinB
MADDRSTTDMLADLGRSQQALLDILNGADQSTLYRRPTKDGWALAEVLVHIAEAREFFTAETRRVLAEPGVKMGRTMDHPGRIQNVKEHGGASMEVIRQRLLSSYQTVLDTLKVLSGADLQVEGEHVRFGRQTLAEFIQHFIVEHDEAHVRQARAAVVTKGRT